MIGFDEALSLVVARARPLRRETLPLAEAAGRCLAAPVVAGVDSPPADVSAMDGYAARDEDLPELALAGTSWPGTPFAGSLGPGECVRIFTGAEVPAGADRIVIQEIVTADGNRIRVTGTPGSGRHIRRRGSDFAAGETLLPAGRLLDARALVAAAGADVAALEVWARPRVAVLGTGDELAEPGEARTRPGTIPESVTFGVAALAESFGASIVMRARLPDEPHRLREAAEQALEAADLVVMTGGASVGEKDFAKAVFEELGLERIFSKVAIKPGKPVWFGTAAGRLVMGLPGNPTSALVTARLLLAPLLRGLAGGIPCDAVRWRASSLAEAMPACGDRETFVRGRWRGDAVEALANQDSGAQRALAEAELLIRRRAGAPAVEAGTSVEIIDF